MATDPRLETLRLLASIDATLRAMLLVLSERRPEPVGQSAPQVTLDGPHGDPICKAKSPRDWAGDDMTGRHFSECPPDYLDLLAERYDYFAGKEEDATKKRYNLLDAARARGWAARMRSGWTAPARPAKINEADTEPQW
jgi:hypothetical protein